MLISRKIRWLLLFAALGVLYFDVLVKWAVELWNDDNYSHGLLVPFVSLYFVRSRLGELREALVRPFLGGVVIVLSGLCLFILGNIGGEIFSKRLSLILVIYGLVVFLEGREVAGLIRFPVGILFFAVPLPYILYNSVAFPLKLIATRIAVVLLNLYGMPVFHEGNIIHLSHTTLEVVDACSGIRSLMTLITLAFFLACLMHKKLFLRLLVISLAIPVVVLMNGFRVALNGVLSKYYPFYLESFWHEFSGWLVFVCAFALLWLFSYLLGTMKKRRGGVV